MILGGYVLVAVIGYLLGSVSSGYLIGRLHGVDVRKHGSGKTGGTNVARVIGWPRTAPVAIIDPGKAMLAIWIARYVTHNEWGAVVAAFACLIGHNWSVFLGFKGGRGIGPVIGALLVFDPLIAIIAMVSGFLVAVISRYVSLGSIVGCVIVIVLSVVLFLKGDQSVQHLVFAVVSCSLIIVQHKDNIQRLLAGTERRLGERVKITPEQQA